MGLLCNEKAQMVNQSHFQTMMTQMATQRVIFAHMTVLTLLFFLGREEKVERQEAKREFSFWNNNFKQRSLWTPIL